MKKHSNPFSFGVVSTSILLVIFFLGLIHFHSTNDNIIDCGSYTSYIGKGNPQLPNPDKIEALTCFNQSFTNCELAILKSTGSDWEGGKHKNNYEIIKTQNSCYIKHKYEVKAFYVNNGIFKKNQNCNNLNISNYNLQLLECKEQ